MLGLSIVLSLLKLGEPLLDEGFAVDSEFSVLILACK
jgi:hypothetical protein